MRTDHTSERFGIHWFRRDLRVADNPAFTAAYAKNSGRVLGLYLFGEGRKEDYSTGRFGFQLETLRELRRELRALGSDLLCLLSDAKLAFPELLRIIAQERGPELNTVSFNREYETDSLERDAALERLLSEAGVEVISQRDHLLVEPAELEKQSGGPYQVFTPFARRWKELVFGSAVGQRLHKQSDVLRALPHDRRLGQGPFQRLWNRMDVFDEASDSAARAANVPLPPAGSRAAFDRLAAFEQSLAEYSSARDVPGRDGTSRLSIYLNNGTITTAQIIRRLRLAERPNPFGDAGEVFLSELIWREFFHHIMFHFPFVENAEFRPEYRKGRWAREPTFFEAWQEGRTGFPIVDAGMRQLRKTGWMHNRVRMIVASFLTKDLLIDWRAGARWFMRNLIDGDRAANNGGWQWAASTGCDAQPYFRIFNPWTQSKRFDPEGRYIRSFVPELSDCPAAELHKPQSARVGYPRPIVLHEEQRLRALDMYRSAARA